MEINLLTIGPLSMIDILDSDDIYHRKEFLFSTCISMAYLRFAIIVSALKPNYKCPFFHSRRKYTTR